MSIGNTLKFILQEEAGGDQTPGGGDDQTPTPTPSAEPTAPVMSSENWRDFLPEDIREDPSLVKYTDLGAFAKGHMNAVGMIGKDKITMPETDEQWSDTFNKLGRPADATGYDIKLPEGLTEEQQFDDEFTNTLRTTIHTLGLNNTQAQGINDFLYNISTNAANVATTAAKELDAAAATQLRTTYGADVDAVLDRSLRVVQAVGGEAVGDKITRADLAKNPILVDIFTKLADTVLEDQNLADGSGVVTAESLKATMNALMQNPAYMDRKNVEHQSTVDQVYKIRQQLNAHKT